MTDQNQEQQDRLNTDQQYIAGVYAKSVIDASEKTGKTEEVLEQLDSFVSDVLGKIPQLDAALQSPRVTPEEKSSLIDSALAGKADQTLINFLKVLNNHDRLDCLPAINQQARTMFNELRGRVEAAVTVADELTPSLEKEVQEKLKSVLGKDVILSVKIDPEIIGGMIVKVGDTVYDTSVSNQLAQVRASALDQTMQKVRDSIGTFVSDSEAPGN